MPAIAPRSKTARKGFSLIEALVVLAIGGMALAIIFSIGIKAGDTGFGLGRRAMSAADGDLANSDLRAIVRSLALRPVAAFRADLDTPVRGDAERLEGDVVMERATLCAPQGWAGRLILAIEPQGNGHALTCSAGDRTAVLADLAETPAAFSYSLDGQTWSSTYTNLAPERSVGQAVSETVWIRFNAGDLIDVVEVATSGRPETWVRADG